MLQQQVQLQEQSKSRASGEGKEAEEGVAIKNMVLLLQSAELLNADLNKFGGKPQVYFRVSVTRGEEQYFSCVCEQEIKYAWECCLPVLLENYREEGLFLVVSVYDLNVFFDKPSKTKAD